MTLERLLEVNNKITALLGRTISIREHAVKQFRKRIGDYVDSHNKKDEIQAWPLVKVCKLKHNWQVSLQHSNHSLLLTGFRPACLTDVVTSAVLKLLRDVHLLYI